MKNVVKKITKNKWSIYIAIFVVGILIAIPMLNIQILDTHDGKMHILRIIGLKNSMEKSSFPFLIQPYYCRDFGYSMCSLYPQLVAYIPYLFAMIVNSFSLGLKIYAILTIPLSGIFMYNFVKEVTSRKDISFLSAIIYMTIWYRFEDIFVRFAIGEFTAFVFLPIVFEGLYSLVNGDRKKHFYIAIGGTGLLLSHTITTVYTMFFCIIYLLLNFRKVWNKETVKTCIINGVFILLMSSMFVIPLIEYKSQAQYAIFMPNVISTNGEYAQRMAIDIRQLFSDNIYESTLSYNVGAVAVFMFAITVLAWRKIKKEYKDLYITFFIFACICIDMCTKFFPWKIMPQFLCNIQYPWRMIGFVMFFLTPIFAINICTLLDKIKNEKVKYCIYAVCVIIIIATACVKTASYKYEDSQLDKKYVQSIKDNPQISHFSLNRDYMPYKAIKKQYTYVDTRLDTIYVLKGNTVIENINKDGLSMQAKINNAKEGDILELPYFYYPGYEIELKAGENEIKINAKESENGFVQITIPRDIEYGEIYFKYTGTIIEKMAYMISAISLVIFIIYVNKEKHNAQKE